MIFARFSDLLLEIVNFRLKLLQGSAAAGIFGLEFDLILLPELGKPPISALAGNVVLVLSISSRRISWLIPTQGFAVFLIQILQSKTSVNS